MRQTQKASCLIGDIAEVNKTAALADDIQQVTMFKRGRIRPVPGCAGTGIRSAEAHEHRPAGHVAHITHQPIAALPPAAGQIMSAHRLDVLGEAARKFSGVAGHHTISRSTPLCCVEALDRLWDSASALGRNIIFAAT